MNDFSLNRQSTMSWPGLLVILLASWGILKTSPPMISRRPRVETKQPLITTGAQEIPARLWQDPLALAYQLERDDKSQYEPPALDQVLHGLPNQPQPMLFLTVLLPNSNFAEGAEQCRRHRYAVVSALGQAHFTPQHSDAIGYVRICLAANQCTDENPNGDEIREEPLIVPFEWFERERDSRLIFLHWVDESRLSATPLANLAKLHEQFKTALAAAPAQPFRHAILGPVSSTTLKRMQQEKESSLSDVTIYSTQATADSCHQVADSNSSPRLLHVIGRDRELADAIVEELFDRRGISRGDPIALIAEWDTDYGRNMFATFRDAIATETSDAHLLELKYLRGLDGQLSGTSSSKDDEVSTDRASGLSQIDYVRRLVVQLKGSENPLKAIGVVGSDVYDKLLLMKALRHEFPTAVLFTTDLDDRLLDRREFESTHNLLIASHYDLSLPVTLQLPVPPFRSSYQTSQFLGTLVLLRERQLIDDTELKNAVAAAGRALDAARPVLLFEVGRTKAFNLNKLAPNPLHPKGDRESKFLKGNQLSTLVVGVVMTFVFLFFFRGPVQKFVLTALRREFGWAHCFTLGVVIAAIGLALLIRNEHFYNPNGEPFALYEGISIWPTICLRVFLVCFCIVSVFQYQGELNNSYENVSRTELGMDPPWKHLSLFEDCAKSWKYIKSPHRWSWWIANNLSGWNRQLKGPVESVAKRCTWNEWRRYGRWSQPVMQHFRMLPHLLIILGFVTLMLFTLGFATSPARGDRSRSFNVAMYTVSGIFILWLIFYVLDSIRLCNRWVEQVASDTERWPDSVLTRAVDRYGTPDNQIFRRILDLLLDVRVVARHTEVASKMVYAPCVALLIGFISRHSVFDNWSWAPRVSLTFGLTLLITLYSATLLGRSSLRAKRQAVRTVEGLIKSMPSQGSHRARAEELLQDIRSIGGGAMVPLRRNPVVAAALLPFGSLSSVYLLEFLLEHIGQ